MVQVNRDLEADDAGKDTGKFRQAGANPVVLAAPGICQITYIIPDNQDFALRQALAVLTPNADLILVDGPAHGLLPRVIMMESGEIPQLSHGPNPIALVISEPKEAPASVPVFQPDQIPGLARYVLKALEKKANLSRP
jgi:molybdopterin-guanine dinucleotide biosynthesis protein B